jgi:hypothetical protein
MEEVGRETRSKSKTKKSVKVSEGVPVVMEEKGVSEGTRVGGEDNVQHEGAVRRNDDDDDNDSDEGYNTMAEDEEEVVIDKNIQQVVRKTPVAKKKSSADYKEMTRRVLKNFTTMMTRSGAENILVTMVKTVSMETQVPEDDIWKGREAGEEVGSAICVKVLAAIEPSISNDVASLRFSNVGELRTVLRGISVDVVSTDINEVDRKVYVKFSRFRFTATTLSDVQKQVTELFALVNAVGGLKTRDVNSVMVVILQDVLERAATEDSNTSVFRLRYVVADLDCGRDVHVNELRQAVTNCFEYLMNKSTRSVNPLAFVGTQPTGFRAGGGGGTHVCWHCNQPYVESTTFVNETV